MNKSIITIVVVAVVVLGGYFFFRGSYQPAPSVPQPSNQQTTPQPSVSGQSSDAVTPQSSVGQTPAVEEKVATYTDSGYSPSTITVKKGEAVTFKNQSSRSMWTASAVHPTHRGYPTTGGCISSTFDACQGIQPGNSWSFTFDIAGTWKYHDHLNPGDTGAIVVE